MWWRDSVCRPFAFLVCRLFFAVSISVEQVAASALLGYIINMTLFSLYHSVRHDAIKANNTAAAKLICVHATFLGKDLACSRSSLLPTGFSEQKKHATSPPSHHTRQSLNQVSTTQTLTTLLVATHATFLSVSVWRVRRWQFTNARLGK